MTTLAPHRIQHAVAVAILCLSSGLFANAAEMRKWKSANGKFDVMAELVAAKGDTVKLKRADGKEFEVKLTVLSQADRDFVRNLQSAPKKRVLTLPGVMSIENPGNGFIWKSGGRRVTDGVQAFRLGCGKPDSKSTITLELELQKSDTDQARRDAVQKNYQNLLKLFRDAALKEVKTPNLRITPPIPDRVAYAVSALNPDGSPFEFRVVHLFNENTYRFHVVASSKAEADMLAAVSGTLTELGTEVRSTSGKMVDGRYQHASFGFSIKPPTGFEPHTASAPNVAAQFREPSGAVMNIRCSRRSPDFDLNAVFAQVQAAPTKGLENFKAIDSGNIQIADKPGKWRIVSHEVNGTPLSVCQYYFASSDWVYIVTATVLADRLDDFRPGIEAAVQDTRFGRFE